MRRNLISAVLCATLLSCVAAWQLSGQSPRLAPLFPTSQPVAVSTDIALLPDSAPRTRTYWVEGAVIGALGGLVLANMLNGLSCGDSSECGGGRALFIGLFGGFVVGGLIGGGIKKES
jgi:hypothetical protein